MSRLLQFILTFLIFSPILCGCTSKQKVLRMAVTTSTRDTGLLDELIPIFEKENNVRVDVIAKGTGAAIKLGSLGDVDLILVHARAAEDEFMAAEHGVRREDVMHNTFEILGPKSDPAEIKGMEVSSALRKIAAGKHPFISRGDDSGTHKRELLLWKTAGGINAWSEYLEAGQGMGKALIMANEKQAYVLTDRGTFLKFEKKIELRPLVTGSENLMNPYGIIVINPNKNDRINAEMANKFVDFMISKKVQLIIQEFKLEGEQLFYPARLDDQRESQ